MDFPQYRKLENSKAYYKILSEREFIELQVIGSRVLEHCIKAEKYPEILRIQDMLADDTIFLKCTEDEFLSIEGK